MEALTKNRLPLASIHIPPEEDARIRDPENLAKSVTEMARSIIRFGQMQPILIQRLDEPIGKKEWKLVDGQTRYVTLLALTARHSMGEEEVLEAFESWGMVPGEIEITTRDSLDPITALMMEFHANEDRENFTWDEKAKYIRRIHDMLQTKQGRREWGAKETAEAIGQSQATVSHYLQLTNAKDPATKSDRVKKATTKGAALKQLKIEQERQTRKARVAAREKRVKEGKEEVKDYNTTAKLAVYHGDCREWIKKIPDNSLEWFHWDPPWGGDEGRGGAFAAHDGVQTDHNYAMTLMTQMLPEIWRVLHDGAWLVMWYTPVHYNWLRLLMQGHRFSAETSRCYFCDKHIIQDHVWLSENYSCVKSPFRFWVNPYPNFWRKPDRKADGHEITRFLTKETETFLLAGKQGKQTPILMRSDRGNVFDYNNVPREVRRHVNHKPSALFSEILTLISVPGSLGADAGGGSGSILEGASMVNRKVLVAEMDEDHHTSCLSTASDIYKRKNYGPDSIASWLEESFGG